MGEQRNNNGRQSTRHYTDFLVSTPTFWIGMGSVFNIAGCYFDFNYSRSSEEADRKALECDRDMIVQDFKDTLSFS
jgi:hypothetical protein